VAIRITPLAAHENPQQDCAATVSVPLEAGADIGGNYRSPRIVGRSWAGRRNGGEADDGFGAFGTP
jgi:hypothetical protein